LRVVPGPQLADIRAVHPDVTDEEALAALEDKGGKCVAPQLSFTVCARVRVRWALN